MFFKSKLKSPVSGELIATNTLPDPMFAESMIGPTFAVVPTDNQILSPVSGKVTMIADTLHAFNVTDKNGAEFLVHIGIDTVSLKQEGFKSLVSLNEEVSAGTPIIEADFNLISERGLNTSVMIILLNSDKFNSTPSALGAVTPKSPIATYSKK